MTVARNRLAYACSGDLQILDSRACVERLAELTQYENRHFDDTFAWTVEQNAFWTDRACAVYAAIVQNGSTPRLVASMSVLLISRESCKQLVAGEINERELRAWSEEPGCQYPIVYFASVIASSKTYLPVLYASLADDASELLQKQRLSPREGFAIAASDCGRQHLERNGFRCVDRERYLGEHHFMRITAAHAQTPFWRTVLTKGNHSPAYLPDQYAFPTRSPFFA